jgi:hypothetical protein
MTTGKLPLKPDSVSGMPRPPEAPLGGGRRYGHGGPTNTSTAPDSPPGLGPALEWTTRPWTEFLGGVAFMVAIAIVFLTLGNGDMGWAAYWVNWLIIVSLSALGVLIAVLIAGGLVAGADWVRYGKEWVKTYELTEVKLGEPRAKNSLILKDSDGREFSISLWMLQSNRKLSDLVYNGMLHSVYYNGATVNDPARERLLLDPQLHILYYDNLI